MIIVREILPKNNLKTFIGLKNTFYKNNKYYVPASRIEEMNVFHSSGHNDCRLFLALDAVSAETGEKKVYTVVGRVAVFEDRCERKKRRLCFGRLDFIDNPEVSRALLNKVLEIAKEKGSDEIIGPCGFNRFDRSGLLTDGFTYPGNPFTVYNEPYYYDHLISFGFREESSRKTVRIPVPAACDKRSWDFDRKLIEKYGFTVGNFRNRDNKEILTDIIRLDNEINEDCGETYPSGFVRLLLNLPYSFFVTDADDSLSAFVIAVPDFGKALKGSRGRMSIRVRERIKKGGKETDGLLVLRAVIKEKFRNTGLDMLVLNRIFASCIDFGFKFAEIINGNIHFEKAETVKVRTVFRYIGNLS